MANVIWKARKNNFLGLPWTFTVYGFSEDRLIKEQLSELIEKERDSKRVLSREFVGFNDMEDNSVEDF